LSEPRDAVSKGVVRELQARDWPGNVRELESVVERAVISSPGAQLVIGWDGQGDPAAAPTRAEIAVPPGQGTLLERERAHIAATLERVFWRIEGEGGAAELLGVNASTLRGRMRKHGIRPP